MQFFSMYFLLLDPANQYVNYLPDCLKEQEFVINYMDCSWKLCHESVFLFSHIYIGFNWEPKSKWNW